MSSRRRRARRSSTTSARAGPSRARSKQAGGVPVVNRVGHAFIKHRMRKEDALFAGEVSAHYYFRDFSQADTGVVRSSSCSTCSRGRRRCPSSLRRIASAFSCRGVNTPVADVPLKLQELKERYTAAVADLAPRRPLGRLRRLALQRPPVQHRGAPATQPRSLLRGNGEKRDEVWRDSCVGRRVSQTLWEHGPSDRPASAVQVLRTRTRLVLRHGRTGGRLLRRSLCRSFSITRGRNTTAISAGLRRLPAGSS